MTSLRWHLEPRCSACGKPAVAVTVRQGKQLWLCDQHERQLRMDRKGVR